jgi:TolB-like protein
VVLPLVNLNKDEDLDYFSYGFGEELSINLALIQGLKVISHYSAMHYNGMEVELRRIGEDLQAEYMVTGSIYRGTERLRVVVQLNHSSSGRQLWGHRYDIALSGTDLFALQEDVTQQLVATIADYYGAFSQTLWKASRRKPVHELTIYEAILWNHYYVLTISPDAHQQAREALEHAVQIEPDYALAWAMLSALYADMYSLFVTREPHLLEQAKTYARKAVTLDPDFQHAYHAIGHASLLEKDYPQVIRAAECIIELNPNAAFMVGVAGYWLIHAGECEDGKQYLDRSVRLNPFYPKWFDGTYFLYYYMNGEYEHALDALRQYNFPGGRRGTQGRVHSRRYPGGDQRHDRQRQKTDP